MRTINSIRPMLMRLSLFSESDADWTGEPDYRCIRFPRPVVGQAEADASAGNYKMPERASTTATEDCGARAAEWISFMKSSPRRCIRGRCFLASMRMLPLRRYVMLTGPFTVRTLFMNAPLVGEVDDVAFRSARSRRRHVARGDRNRGVRVDGRGCDLCRRIRVGHCRGDEEDRPRGAAGDGERAFGDVAFANHSEVAGVHGEAPFHSGLD